MTGGRDRLENARNTISGMTFEGTGMSDFSFLSSLAVKTHWSRATRKEPLEAALASTDTAVLSARTPDDLSFSGR